MQRFEARPAAARPRLYGFLLFDERESQRPVAAFAEDEFAWLDQLAGSARIVLFLFLRPKPAQAASGGESQILAVQSGDTVENPSLRVATAFHVRPADLPGVLFFTRLDLAHGPNEGLFWPLPIQLFETDRRRAENEFAQLFSLVQEVVLEDRSPEAILDALCARLRAARRERFSAPIFAALRDGVVKVVKFPGALIEAMGQAWATEIARRMVPE
jgi:hypothetical protein